VAVHRSTDTPIADGPTASDVTVRRDLVVLVHRVPGPDDPVTTWTDAPPFVDLGELGTGPVLDLPHSSARARARFGRRPGVPVDALVWLAPGQPIPGSLADTYDEAFRMTVSTHVGWRPGDWATADPADVVKQVSLLAAGDGYGPDRFSAHYRHHVDLARRHMPALWQYAQNDVISSTATTDAGRAIVAVSELWFKTTDDFCHRYFPSQADQDEFSSHEGFLDLTKAVSFVGASHRLATA